MPDDYSELLDPDEIVWRGRFDWLKARGYRLPVRLAKDWKPSWIDSGESEHLSADSSPCPVSSLVI